jgi:hypothetical protein
MLTAPASTKLLVHIYVGSVLAKLLFIKKMSFANLLQHHFVLKQLILLTSDVQHFSKKHPHSKLIKNHCPKLTATIALKNSEL